MVGTSQPVLDPLDIPDWGVCVVIGATADCSRGPLLTNNRGLWEQDISASPTATASFSMTGYVSEQRQIPLRPGQAVTYTISVRGL
jgi:hypothetical protein